MKKKVVYIKCPRCDLNFIDKKNKLCNVCKAELNLVSPSILIPDEDSEETLCPRCHENFITAEEEMCYECFAKYTEELTLKESEDDDDDDWKYVAEVTDDPLPIDEIGLDLPEELEHEFAQDIDIEEEEEEIVEEIEDDFDDYVDEIDEADFEYDDDDEDEDEDEDFDF